MEQASEADKKRFGDLFEKLDVNKDGKIEASELATGLAALRGVKDVDKHAQVTFY
jgi:Ca2+-binding EF-hand superfamily protein